MIRFEPPTRSSRLSSPVSFLSLALAALACALACAPAAAQPGIRSLAELEDDVRFQPPSFRLEAMGGLGLAVRDTYNQINLWDFGGLPLGLAGARDSTSLDVWANGIGRTLDERTGGVSYGVDRQHDSQYAGEGVVRSGNLAVGADVGSFAFRRGAPFGDQSHLTDNASQPAFVPVATGRFKGPVHWGLRGIIAKESSHEQLWSDEVQGGEVTLKPTGNQLGPPNLFTPDHRNVPIYGLGVSLGWFEKKKWQAAPYLDYRRESVSSELSTVRSQYGTTEKRDIWGYGLAVIAHPIGHTEFGAEVGRELFSSTEHYSFTLSGGSVDPAFTGRGERLLRNRRHDYLNLRVQADLSNAPVTLGAAYRVHYDHEQIQGMEGRPTDFNTFVQEKVAPDTIQAPALVESGRDDVRGIDFGGGASLRLMDRKATVGGEYRHFRDAIGGTYTLAHAVGWEARLGGEYLVSKIVSVRAGYRHHREDQDTDTPRNELVADRATAGLEYGGWRHWTIEGYGYREWWRTDFPDPQELGGPGTGFGLTLHRLF